MLTDFREWSAWNQKQGFWTREDAQDIGSAIDEAIRDGDPSIIASWAAFLATNAEEVRCMKGLARAAYERIMRDIKARLAA